MNKTEKPRQLPSKIKFVYRKPDAYPTYYANGAFGAINPRRDFEFNFFFEHREPPEEEVMKVEGDQLKPEEKTNITEITIARD